MGRRGLIGALVAVGTALAPGGVRAQSDVLACQSVPTYFPRRDRWPVLPEYAWSYNQQADGSNDISNGADLRAVKRAFATWMDHLCPGDVYPNIFIVDANDYGQPRHPTRDDGDTETAFKSVIYFVESGWGAGSATVALTTNSFFDDTGYLVDSDMAFNGVNFSWRARYDPGSSPTGCTAGSSNCFDVETVALHEAGHYLGLNHVDCADAVMFPHGSGTAETTTLSIHEQTALCKLYPPRPDTNLSVRHFGEECETNADCSTGLCIHPLNYTTEFGWCTYACDCTDGCTDNCPQSYECVTHGTTGTKFCRAGVHLTGGGTSTGCGCDTTSGCTPDCDCDQDCIPCSRRENCPTGQICDGGTCGPCSDDAQCDGQLCTGGSCVPCSTGDCDGGLVCKSGVCSPCSGNPDCDPQVCISGRCSACSSNCPGGQVCVSGTCEDCTTDPQCDGQVCVAGACVDCSTSNPCASHLVCSGGRCGPCQNNSDCSGGRYCAAGVCKPCTESGQCDAGQVCTSGVCQACQNSGECAGGRVCAAGVCTDCSSDLQCSGTDVCNQSTGRCGPPDDDGGGVTDPGTGLSLDFCQPCTNGTDCASGVCLGDGSGTSICTHACMGATVNGENVASAACPPTFDCITTDLGFRACWPEDMASCGGGSERPVLNAVCYEANGPGSGDDWYTPCGPGLVCFAFKPRCAGKQGACVLYCNEDEPCPAANMQCCYGVDGAGACQGYDEAAGRVHGGCFEIRDEGESCITAEQSICGPGLGCFSFSDPSQAKCYQFCSSTCDVGSTCAQFSDDCSNQFALCCDSSTFPTRCDPGATVSTKQDVGYTCTGNSDCDSDFCATHGSRRVCSRTCNAVTTVGCPAGFDCLTLGGPDPAAGFCWPSEGPIDDPDPPDDGGGGGGKPKPPPEGLCSSVGGSGLALWLGVLALVRRRRRR